MLNQGMAGRSAKTARQVVRGLGAVQAQDYLESLWSIGLRMSDAKQADVEKAILDREIVRTWPMRGTLHFVAAEDARWMTGLLASRVISRSAGRIRRMGVDEEDISRGRKLILEILQGKTSLTRAEIYRQLDRAGVPVSGQRGLQILWWLAHEGLICLGTHRGKQPTFVLLDEWIPMTKSLSKEDALTALAERYFTSHGPATLRDFVWWSGLNVSEGRDALQGVGERLVKEEFGGIEYWLSPGLKPSPEIGIGAHLLSRLDEYVVAYKSREAILEPRFAKMKVRGLPVLFQHKIVVDGAVLGTWRRTLSRYEVEIELNLFTRLPGQQLEAVEAAAEKYGRFLGKKALVERSSNPK